MLDQALRVIFNPPALVCHEGDTSPIVFALPVLPELEERYHVGLYAIGVLSDIECLIPTLYDSPAEAVD